MTLFDSVGPSHWGASPTKFGQIMYNIVQKLTETGYEASGTTVTAYPISFLTITGVFSMGTEVIIVLRNHTECPIQSFCGQNWVTCFSFPLSYLDNVSVTAHRFPW